MRHVEFADLVFEFGLRDHSWEGLMVEPGGFTGWDDSPGIRRTSTPRPNAPGSFHSEGFLGDKIVILAGNVIAHSGHALQRIIDRIHAIPAGDYFPLMVDTGVDVRWTWGTRNSVNVQRAPAAHKVHSARFQVQIWCPDPWKYGKRRSFEAKPGDSVEIINRGTHPSWPTATVRGPVASGWSLLGFTVNRAVASNEVIEIDAVTGSFVSSTVGELMEVVSGYPVAIPAGVSSTTFAGSGNGSAEIFVTEVFG